MTHLHQLLEKSQQQIVSEATQALSRAHLKHYDTSGEKMNRGRLTKLYELTLDCVKSLNLIPMIEYARDIARKRHRDGFDLQEVHAAFNVLEEVIWKWITRDLTPSEYPEAFGLVGTILGAGKQALAVEYVSLASQKSGIESLDLRALFKGTN